MRKTLFIPAVLFFILSFGILYFNPGAVQSLQAAVNNSDLLFPFSLFKGIADPTSSPDWLFGANTPFLELLVGFLFWLLSRNAQITFASYAIFQPVVVTLCLLYLISSLIGRNWKVYSLALVFSALPVLVYASGHLTSLYYLFSWYLHVTTAGAGYVVLGAILRYTTFQGKGWKYTLPPVLIIAICTLVTVLSDAIFLSQFVAPLLCLLIIMAMIRAIPFRRAVVASLTLLYATAAGLALYQLPRAWGADRLVLYGSYMNSDPSRLFSNLPILSRKVAEVLEGQVWVLVAWAAFYLLCAFAAGSILARWRWSRLGAIRTRYWMVVVFLLLQMLASISSNLITNDPSIRYLVPVIYMPLFWGWPVLLIAWPKWLKALSRRNAKIFGYALPSAALILIVINLVSSLSTGLPDLASYYPETIACIDLKTTELGLHHGIAHYWQARYTTILSKTGLVVAPVNPDLSPQLVLNNTSGYRADFDFAIIDHNPPYLGAWVQRETVTGYFGLPAETFSCGESDILVYNRESDTAFRRQFEQSPALTGAGQ